MQLFVLNALAPDAGGALGGGFTRVGTPTVKLIGGQHAVFFDGKGDTYELAQAPAELCGAHPRTVEVWAFKESVRGDEETLIGWGRRGGPTASNMALNWGNNGAYGGATHWSADMGWHGTPKAGQWHHLVYTYDGKTARLYDNGAEKANMDLRLATPQGFPIRLAVQNAADADLLDPAHEARMRPLYDRYIDLAFDCLSAGWEYTMALPRGQIRAGRRNARLARFHCCRARAARAGNENLAHSGAG